MIGFGGRSRYAAVRMLYIPDGFFLYTKYRFLLINRNYVGLPIKQKPFEANLNGR